MMPESTASPGVSVRARSTRSGSETRARDQVVNVRVSAEEHARWSAFADAQGLPLAKLLRLSVESMILADQAASVRRNRD